MSSTSLPWRLIAPVFRAFRRLGLRTLILTIFAIALINVAGLIILSRSGNFDQGLVGPPMVRQAAAAAELIDALPPDARNLALVAVNSPSLRLTINDDFSRTPPVENPAPVFVPIIAVYTAVLGDRPFSVYRRTEGRSWLPRSATLADDLIIVMRLADGSGLVVENGEVFRRQVAFYGIALIMGVISLVLVGLMTWASLSYAGPLARLASASKSFVEAADSTAGFTPLPETGPKPVRDLAVALNLAGTKLVTRMIERTTTLAAIAHDLRTYLTRLRMRSEFIEDVTQREKITVDIEDMTQLIEDTLLLGNDAIKPPRMERVELSGWVHDYVARRAELGEPVVMAQAAGPAYADIAAPGLTRVLNNLVDNALRYAGEAMLAVHIDDPASVAIEVIDQGPGVPEDFLERMSQPFTRVEGSRSRDTGGAGLGLAIAKALVEQIGGSLDLVNRTEGGFSARVTLPRS